MEWKKIHNSYMLETVDGHKLLVSTGINDKWYFSFNIGEKVWGSDPTKQPYDTGDSAKRMCEVVYREAIRNSNPTAPQAKD